ncbi:MAG: CorA family divalent cation transporter, partial [Alphaproteobacteria bacterium]
LSTQLTRSLLDYRNAVVTARETIYELATRRSPFVSESTQPFLDRQTDSLERLAVDAATERTVLSEVLNLYMGIVSHRTNRVVDRLTIVSLIFLPLNFLAAVYGMNFEIMPELQWQYGYFIFWGVACTLVASLIFVIKRRRWI